MANIKSPSPILILTVGAGTDTAKVLYEIQTTHTPLAKRMIVGRKSKADPGVYFFDHEDLQALGVLPDSVVLNLYEDTWPVDMTPQLTAEGTLPTSFNAQFAQADFGIGKVGIIEHNGYDRLMGSFKAVTKTVAGAKKAAEDPELPWYKRAAFKFYAWTAVGVLGIVGLIVWLGKKR